ncbi:glycerol-3-phosphate dehydrogenase/oxidase [Corallincola luteus]|uniref:Glycerol-3-phosphate dehydrogenase/oxidase n=1 Tax=Corallincola luteus TaxID=1775177 RepID=A0ABY2ASF5_9GAMM|nr:glycerol-3-phosphate dehydrogenase/oxidase [Corallincola luteus]TCI05196.1 glycerol-3-phosphate dehydrogenase/oxidase [Corallincola luteus]
MATDYDVVVIGAGINGVGVAEALAAAGYKTLVVEKSGVGTQTSSRSSKLIHGGLRYLESGQFGLVRKALKARATLLHLAPELVKPTPFVIPVYPHSQRQAGTLRLGLGLYALLSGFDPLGRFQQLAIPDLAKDGLNCDGVSHALQYWDASTDDQVLTVAVMESALRCGAELLCPATLTALQQVDGGYRIDCDLLSADKVVQQQSLTCAAVVNCAGPWVNEVISLVTPNSKQVSVEWVQGAHIILDHPAPSQVYYLESPTDHRVVFVMPWQGQTMVGTTETVFQTLPEEIRPTAQEICYLEMLYRHYFPNNQAKTVASFAGLRVLPKLDSDAFSRPRDTLLFTDPQHPDLLSVYGGKLTTYRDTASRVLNWSCRRLGARESVADYPSLPLYPPVNAVASPAAKR